MAAGKEGGNTLHQPSGDVMSIYEAAERYRKEGVPQVILAGDEYGTGSSRDWAAKGTNLLGVKAVIAESFERIHRANLVGMGVLPLQFTGADSAQSLGIKGDETVDILGVSGIQPQQDLKLQITQSDGRKVEITVKCRIDTAIEVDYYRHGGILPFVLRELMSRAGPASAKAAA
jgi:aconitate hydratase